MKLSLRAFSRLFLAIASPSRLPRWTRCLVYPALLAGPAVSAFAEPLSLSGIYPSLAMFNQEDECGTGAVVSWAGKLWVVTYAPHRPLGSTDKLYEITPDLKQIVRPESVGGTPANRMIHRESEQLFISYYAIDAQGDVRVIPPDVMPGRPTGTARHLTDPENKVYYATMEEGFYEVDVHTLDVTELYPDGNMKPEGEERLDILPGYHGKGLYSGQGVLVYANNGEHGQAALEDPTHVSGVLAEWDGKDWTVIRRNQFTEVTGKGGIDGADDPSSDPIWSIGWDYRSLILMTREDGEWRSFRLPKSSHSYDGAHGWNTEWPRIREIGDDQPDLLMTMHGAFWWFPEEFSAGNTAGIRPRSNYLKVIGDFTRWGDRIVLGTDDTAKREFLNTRRAKGRIAAPQSQSNLWFVEPELLDELGPVIGRGGVWVQDDVPAGTVSEPFLIGGFDRGVLHVTHGGEKAAKARLEVDRKGDGQWSSAGEIALAAKDYKWIELPTNDAVWMRLISDTPLSGATAWFHLSNKDGRSTTSDPIFDGIAKPQERSITGGIVRTLSDDKRTLSLAAMRSGPDQQPVDVGYYELDGELRLRRIDEPNALEAAKEDARIPVGVLSADDASLIFIDEYDKRWRLPKGDPAFEDREPLGASRVAREVATERDLFNAHGTFYELPARNAGGFSKVRPVSTHNRRIHDYCSYRGLFIISGMSADLPEDNPHIIRSDDEQAALWAGAIDDVWRMGKPRGEGGPWKDSQVEQGVPSDPYLMTAYDKKTLILSHDQERAATFTVEADLTGDGAWVAYETFEVAPGQTLTHEFPDAYSAYWIRAVADRDMTATAWLVYQ